MKSSILLFLFYCFFHLHAVAQVPLPAILESETVYEAFISAKFPLKEEDLGGQRISTGGNKNRERKIKYGDRFTPEFDSTGRLQSFVLDYSRGRTIRIHQLTPGEFTIRRGRFGFTRRISFSTASLNHKKAIVTWDRTWKYFTKTFMS